MASRPPLYFCCDYLPFPGILCSSGALGFLDYSVKFHVCSFGAVKCFLDLKFPYCIPFLLRVIIFWLLGVCASAQARNIGYI